MKRIGIAGYPTGANSFGVGMAYIDLARMFGGVPIILSPESPVDIDLDLLIIPGGPDVNPLRYGEMPLFDTSRPEPIREYFDVNVLPKYIEENVPILGICRGMQTIAVNFGAKLNQHIYHETNPEDDPYKQVHGIQVLNTKHTSKIKVNSRHHQSVKREGIPSVIKVVAVHEKHEQHIEAIAIQGYPIVGVQWHPEDLEDYSGLAYTRMLVKEIVK